MDRVTAVTATGATLVLQLPRVKTGGGGGRETVYLDDILLRIFAVFAQGDCAESIFVIAPR